MYSGSINDSLLDELRKGKGGFIPKNQYIKRAVNLKESLLSLNELKLINDEIFEDKAKLILEIGSYTGETLIELAKANGNIGFIGADIVFKRVVKTAEKIEKYGIKNAKVVIGDGQKLIESFFKNTIDGICVFFPDPWIKKEKKRLLNEDFFKRAKIVLKDKGFIWIKTDNGDYFKQIKNNAEQNGFIIDEKIPNILKEREYPTYFESLFENQNKKLHNTVFSKNPEN